MECGGMIQIQFGNLNNLTHINKIFKYFYLQLPLSKHF